MRALLEKLWSDERGSQSVAFVLFFPLLFWGLCSFYVFTDAFRIRGIVTDAATVVSDTLSRQTVIDARDLEGLQSVAALLTGHETTAIRISQIRCIQDCADLDQRELGIDFSHGQGMVALDDADLASGKVHAMVPLLAPGDRIILSEVTVDYTPAFDFGLSPGEITSIQASRPRFTPQLCWDECNGWIGS